MHRYVMRTTGILLLMMSLAIVISWTGLILRFEYPDVLRQSVDVILQSYHEGGVALRIYWAGMVLSSLLMIPIVMLLYRTNRSLSLVAAGIGLGSAIFHILGFSRWLFTVDYLAAQYVGNESLTLAQQESIELMFQVLHSYVGVTIGETLGFVTMGVWAILTAIALYQAGYLPKWAAYLSDVSGLGILAGVLEWTGWHAAVEVNAYAYQLWILILACLGVYFIRRDNRQ
jgi:hypothetical protein